MSKTTTAGIQSVERRLHTRHRARTTVYITTPTGRKKHGRPQAQHPSRCGGRRGSGWTGGRVLFGAHGKLSG